MVNLENILTRRQVWLGIHNICMILPIFRESVVICHCCTRMRTSYILVICMASIHSFDNVIVHHNSSSDASLQLMKQYQG